MNEKNMTLVKNKIDLINEIKKYEPSFIEFVRERLGINIQYCQTNELREAIIKACEKFNFQPLDYLNLLKKADARSPLLEHLIASVTIGETYFFRDKYQMELLQNTLLPNLIGKKREQGDLTLRIWSAGCASGEEIYTLAIMLREKLIDFKSWSLSLLGTDINTESLQKGVAAIYSEWSMRSISDDIKSRYFTKKNQRYELDNAIRDMVRFDYLNLNDESYPSIFNGTNSQDLIICRNVLIYFNAQCIHRLMKKLSESLAPGGYILLGASDPIDIKDTKLQYHKDRPMLFSREIEAPALEIVAPKQPPTFKKESPDLHKPTPIRPKVTEHIQSPFRVNEAYINRLLNEGQWQKLLDAFNQFSSTEIANSAFLLSAKGSALANLGKLNEAEKYCKESIQLDSTNKYTYLTYALILIELNQFQTAEEMLRKTLFLDHAFVIGHYQLGLLLLRKKQHDAGLKSLKNAFAIVKTQEPNELVQGSQGLSYGRLAEILRYEMDVYAEGIGHGNKNT